MVQAGINLIRPDWVRLRLGFQLLNNVAWLTILFFLLKAGNWIVLAEIPGTSSESYRRTVDILNQYLLYTWIALSVVVAYVIFRQVRRFFRASKDQAPSAAGLHNK